MPIDKEVEPPVAAGAKVYVGVDSLNLDTPEDLERARIAMGL